MPYPSSKVTFTDPAGTSFVAGTPAGGANAVDHAVLHTNINDTVESIQDTAGTTAGTNVLMHFAAGQFPVRHTGVAATGTLVQTLVGGTFANTTLIGTPQITGGSISNPALIGTPQITGGSISSPALIGTPQITGGTFTNAALIGSPTITGGTINSPFIGTPTVKGSLQLQDVGIITQTGTTDNITLTPGASKLVKIASLRRDKDVSTYNNKVVIASGWNYFLPTNGTSGTTSFNFGMTFNETPITFGNTFGYKDGTPTTMTDFTELTGDTGLYSSQIGPSSGSQGFYALRSSVHLTGGGTFIAGRTYLYSWTAIGSWT